MTRFTVSLVTAMILLAGSAWAQVCPTRIPPGHYWCNVHNEICTHGLSTPEVTYNYNYRPNRPIIVNNGYGHGINQGRYVDPRRRNQRRYRRAVRQVNQHCR